MTLDPFFDEFRRRLPDVRVVLLPPDGPDPAPPEAVAPDDAAQRVTDASRLAGDLLVAGWPALSGGREHPDVVTYDWAPGDEPGVVLVRAKARVEGAAAQAAQDATAELRVVGDRLEADGWSVSVRVGSDGAARVLGVRDGVRVEAVGWGPAGPWDVVVGVPARVGDRGPALRATGARTAAWGEPGADVQA